MPDSNAFALHRPELAAALQRGDEKVVRLLGANPRSFAAGSTIIPEGTQHDYVYRLRTGWAARVRILSDGRAQFILVFLPGDLFAVKSMLVILHPDQVMALSDVTCEQIDYRKLKAAFDRDSDVATRCLWQITEEERRLHTWVVSLGQGDADERMAQMLLEFRDRLVRGGSLALGSTEYRLPMTQEQLADLIGVTPVHVSRVLKRFRDEGKAVIRSGVVKLLDIAALRALAEAVQDPFDRDAPEPDARASGR